MTYTYLCLRNKFRVICILCTSSSYTLKKRIHAVALVMCFFFLTTRNHALIKIESIALHPDANISKTNTPNKRYELVHSSHWRIETDTWGTTVPRILGISLTLSPSTALYWTDEVLKVHLRLRICSHLFRLYSPLLRTDGSHTSSANYGQRCLWTAGNDSQQGSASALYLIFFDCMVIIFGGFD